MSSERSDSILARTSSRVRSRSANLASSRASSCRTGSLGRVIAACHIAQEFVDLVTVFISVRALSLGKVIGTPVTSRSLRIMPDRSAFLRRFGAHWPRTGWSATLIRDEGAVGFSLICAPKSLAVSYRCHFHSAGRQILPLSASSGLINPVTAVVSCSRVVHASSFARAISR